jgi:hypothetical protein
VHDSAKHVYYTNNFTILYQRPQGNIPTGRLPDGGEVLNHGARTRIRLVEGSVNRLGCGVDSVNGVDGIDGIDGKSDWLTGLTGLTGDLVG